MRKYILSFLLIPVLLLTSCNNWLDIDPEDRIMEENLFNSREGFMAALNGIYIEMNSSTLYGGRMTVSLFDVLAQYYTAAMPNEHAYSNYKNFSYDQASVKSTYSGIWDKYYNLIANCNTIIEHCDKGKDLLGEEYHNIIKGEALALRALFHFEVLRIWGPIFKENPEMICIPYAETSKVEIRPLLAADAVYGKIKRDLLEAESHLAESDPIITEGPLFSAGAFGEGNDLRYRTTRLNYYAVQALLARAALYCEDRAMALEYARKVVSETQREGEEVFPFVTRGYDLEDRIYQSELLFAHYNLKRVSLWDNYFSNNLSDANVLRVADDLVDAIYEETDYRYIHQWKKMRNPSNAEQYYFQKYAEVKILNSDTEAVKERKDRHRFLVPMLRISEMHYIIAECETDQALALQALNKVRNARALKEITDYSLLAAELEKEYQREFIGEGQLFFYYKRQAKEKIPYGKGYWGNVNTITMTTEKYVPELPDSEKNNRVE